MTSTELEMILHPKCQHMSPEPIILTYHGHLVRSLVRCGSCGVSLELPPYVSQAAQS